MLSLPPSIYTYLPKLSILSRKKTLLQKFTTTHDSHLTRLRKLSCARFHRPFSGKRVTYRTEPTRHHPSPPGNCPLPPAPASDFFETGMPVPLLKRPCLTRGPPASEALTFLVFFPLCLPSVPGFFSPDLPGNCCCCCLPDRSWGSFEEHSACSSPASATASRAGLRFGAYFAPE